MPVNGSAAPTRTGPRGPRWLRALSAAAGAALVASGCGAGGVFEVAATPLSGRIGGAGWSLASAENIPYLSDGPTGFLINGWGVTVPSCTGGDTASHGDQLLLNVPKTVGEYRLSGALTQTFYLSSTSSNLVATTGTMRVDEVTATTVRGGAHFAADANNEVDGTFTASICPPP